jgi:hypothetical protein
VSELGEILEALHDAPRGFDLLVGEISTWHDPETMRRAIERDARRSHAVLSAISVEAPGPSEPPVTRLWLSRDGRFRAEGPWGVQVFDGQHVWVRQGDRLMQLPPADGLSNRIAGGHLVEPWATLSLFALRVTNRARVAGQDVVVLAGVPRPDSEAHGAATLRGMGADRASAHVDPRTGIMLRFETWFEGQPSSRAEFEAIEYDVALAHDPFRFEPDPADRIWTPHDSKRSMLEQAGVDPEGVDLDDDRAVMEAVMSRRGPGPGAAAIRPLQPVALSDWFMPVASPPEPDAARADVIDAIEYMSELDEHGALPNVQGGSNLGDALAQAQQRTTNDEPARFVVDEVAFVRADEAVVRFRVFARLAPGGFPMTGRVLRVNDRWKVERGTFCSLLAMGGVACPPPPDHP